MKPNLVKSKLKRGEPSLGTWLTLPDPIAARLMAGVGFDWLNVEMEHTPTSIETATLSFQAIVAGGCVPLARIPWNTGENIKRVLDNGAAGIVVPMVNSKDEAERVIDAAMYHPLGNRSVGGQLHALHFETDPATYYAKANDHILIVVMAEHVKALEHLDDILAVPGIDAVFIGPNDLLRSMGKASAFESEDAEFVSACKHVLNTAQKHQVAAGIHVITPEAAKARIQEGFQFISIASEAGMMLAKAKEIATQLDLKPVKALAKY